MPEIPVLEEEELKEIVEDKELYFLSKEDTADLFKDKEFDFLGKGGECAVFRRKNEPEKVVALSYRPYTTLEARQIFYLHRIFSKLFPNNIPHFYAMFGHNKKSFDSVSSVRQMVDGKNPYERDEKTASVKSEDIKEPFSSVFEFKNDFDLPVYFDRSTVNFLITDDGKEYYADTICCDYWNNNWPVERIKAYMDQKLTKEGKPAYTDRDKKIVENSIKRLKDINEQMLQQQESIQKQTKTKK